MDSAKLNAFIRGLERLLDDGAATIERYARRKPAQGQASLAWDESKHPRGQPGNAGEFAPGGATAKGTSKEPAPAPTKAGAKPKATRGAMAEAKRVGGKSEARVILADGTPAPAHIVATKVSPEWTDVRVALDPKVDVLVTAFDKAGRSQTIYANNFSTRTAALKFARTRDGLAHRKAMYQENQRARRSPHAAIREAADCLWLIQEQATRPGSDKETGAKVKAYGATTLRAEHVQVGDDGSVWLRFVGKKGELHNHRVRNPELAAMLVGRKESAGSRDGRLFATNEFKLNRHARTLDGGKFTAKDFRTIRANSLALRLIGSGATPTTQAEYRKNVKEVAKTVSALLGNKPGMALKAYIDPTVFAPWRAAIEAQAMAPARAARPRPKAKAKAKAAARQGAKPPRPPGH